LSNNEWLNKKLNKLAYKIFNPLFLQWQVLYDQLLLNLLRVGIQQG